MSLTKIALRIGLPVAVLYLTMQYMVLTAPEPLERYEGVKVAAPPAGVVPTSTPTPLPQGFPSMERPRKILVAEGEQQPIATKYGLTYDIPPGWENRESSVAGWEKDDQTVAIYGSLGYYNRTDCAPSGEYSNLAFTGVTGRSNTDLNSVALEEVDKAQQIYSTADGTIRPSVTISGPEEFNIDNRSAVRYKAVVENIPDAEKTCISKTATMDVVTTPGYASAQTALFVVFSDRGKDNALTDADIDQIISTIRKT